MNSDTGRQLTTDANRALMQRPQATAADQRRQFLRMSTQGPIRAKGLEDLLLRMMREVRVPIQMDKPEE